MPLASCHRSWHKPRYWQQRFFTCDEFYQPGGPIFFYLGNEADVLLYLNNTGERRAVVRHTVCTQPQGGTLPRLGCASNCAGWLGGAAAPAYTQRLCTACQCMLAQGCPTDLLLLPVGLMWELAPRHNALLVFAEHRFYGAGLLEGRGTLQPSMAAPRAGVPPQLGAVLRCTRPPCGAAAGCCNSSLLPRCVLPAGQSKPFKSKKLRKKMGYLTTEQVQ